MEEVQGFEPCSTQVPTRGFLMCRYQYTPEGGVATTAIREENSSLGKSSSNPEGWGRGGRLFYLMLSHPPLIPFPRKSLEPLRCLMGSGTAYMTLTCPMHGQSTAKRLVSLQSVIRLVLVDRARTV